jgi:hypothetical protein
VHLCLLLFAQLCTAAEVSDTTWLISDNWPASDFFRTENNIKK